MTFGSSVEPQPHADSVIELAAYVLVRPGGAVPPELLAHAAAILPSYMVPTRLIGLTAFPTTPAGKPDLKALSTGNVLKECELDGWGAIDRKLLRSTDRKDMHAVDVHSLVLSLVARLSTAEVDHDMPLMDAGFDSLGATTLVDELRIRVPLQLQSTLLFECPTPRAIAAHIVAQQLGNFAMICTSAMKSDKS